jgi:exodeoxyribonuclease-3
MKVATFNVNSIRARLATVLDWIAQESPDVLCLQETKVQDSEFPRDSFETRGYVPEFRGEKGYNGVAVISRKRPEDIHIGFDQKESEGSRIITARIQGIPIVNTYVPQGFHPLSEQFREKLDWLQRLYDYIDSTFRADGPLLWMGDFNVAPEEIDVHDPKGLSGHVGFHPDERAILGKFRDWGLVDVFRLHEQGPEHYTFWDYRVRNAVEKKKGWRIDHIWATRMLAGTSVNARIDLRPRRSDRPSDHTIVVAEFNLNHRKYQGTVHSDS